MAGEMTVDALLSSVLLAVSVALLVKFVMLLTTKLQFHRDLCGFTNHPGGIFFLGHGKAILDGARGMIIDFDNIYEDNEKAMQFWLHPFQPGVVCYHPDTIKTVYATNEPKDHVTIKFINPWIGDGLLTSTGSKWARNRRLLTPGFHFEILKPYVYVFAETARVLAEKWKAKIKDSGESTGECSTNVVGDISLATLHSLMRCIMGVEDNTHKGKEAYLAAICTLSDQAIKRLTHLVYSVDALYAITPDGFTNRKALRTAHGFTEQVIAERRRYTNAGNTKSQAKFLPFIDILLMAKDADGTGLADQEIRDEVDTFMFAGHDTTSSGITWILYNLAHNPDLQERCRHEVDEVMDGMESTGLEWNDLPKLEFLTKFIKESLRLTSPVPATSRHLLSPLTLPDGRVIPKGCAVYCHINGLHRNPNVWKDPLTFDPERFSPENSRGRSPHAYVPFAAGPRNCIGQHFAMCELKVITAVLLHHLRFAPDTSKPPGRINKIVLRSTTGMHLMVQMR